MEEPERQFVCLRVIKANGLDLDLFQFDYDQTWCVMFLNADRTIYGRYGTRASVRNNAATHIAVAGFKKAMERALAVHEGYPANKAQLAGHTGPKATFATPEANPARFKGGECIHCHQAHDGPLRYKWQQKQLTAADLWVYPLPENVGLTLDVDAGDRVSQVTANSAAAAIGVKPGDRLAKLNGFSVASFADAQYALHKAPWKGEIPLTWIRDGKEQSGMLVLAGGWKKTNLTWRPSMLDVLPSAPFAGDDLNADEKKKLGLPEGRAAFRQGDRVHATLADAGLRAGDVVVGFDGAAVDGGTRDLLGYVRRNYLVGDPITINVIRAGKRLDLKHVLR